ATPAWLATYRREVVDPCMLRAARRTVGGVGEVGFEPTTLCPQSTCATTAPLPGEPRVPVGSGSPEELGGVDPAVLATRRADGHVRVAGAQHVGAVLGRGLEPAHEIVHRGRHADVLSDRGPLH